MNAPHELPTRLGGVGVDRAQERQQVVDVRLHHVLLARGKVVVGPGVAPAVRDRPVGLSHWLELRLPDRQIADAAVNEHDGLPGPVL